MPDQENFSGIENVNIEEAPKKQAETQVGKGRIVAAFVFFAIAALAFGVFVVSSFIFLGELFSASETNDIGEAIGTIITVIFTAPFMFFSAIPAVVFTALDAHLMRRIQGGAVNPAANTAFKVFLIIARVMLASSLLLGVFVLAMLLAH